MFLHLKCHVLDIIKKKFGPFVDQPNDVADAYSRNQPTPTDLTDGKIADQPTASVKSGTDADWAWVHHAREPRQTFHTGTTPMSSYEAII